ncbi:murein biosynthesis protein MurJ [Streptomyces ipomoeae]|uniref:Murein biosynthesis protein MurJ n=2 Tax=Streptomyces ipomoeae TaxID=103232 RepID=A0AAE9AX72_9ACTN|nr:lipid II flippase MurJ [Streptomyces ipomoeae]EKX68030.1 putative integral membrane protein MviN [Streptomyces ipomoeae 91-03]MDX2694884.1 lipid II flippase MurJ [Streptomyces ipomoeae]MDX2820825.1 lipid II flippase MurJ [Streptomyces ipomoeae]MDX2839327.1 lipid II flippase MurJ [Streptomyces ipomoeae]MDX2873264.1 lipid II flippase MurJ [Streptomyces ipomoeae]
MTITPPQAGDVTAAAARSCPDAPGAPDVPGAPDPGGRTTFVSQGFLARAAFVTVVLSLAGAVLGLGRDQALAHLFGAGRETDAFLVAWTVPEFAATLLIEDGLAFALVPAFSAVVARRARGDTGDPVRALVRGTLPRLVPAFAVASALLIWGAPYLVEMLAPGLPDPRLAVDCTRLTGTCVLTFGLAGYCSAALRAHRRFVAPAAIYVAYNTAVITGMFVLGGRWGVRAAAIGVAVGGALMIVTQLPSLLRLLHRRQAALGADAMDTTNAMDPAAPAAPADPGNLADPGDPADPADPAADRRAMNLVLFVTVLLFALCRQSQVLIERFLASTLPAGAISHLNFAQKVAQMPMVLALMLCTVTFPVVSQALAEGDIERARDRVERDLRAVSWVVLLGTAAVVACAPQLIHLLFQRGAFTAQDTAATAAVMRVYALGLLGQALVGALVRSYFSAGRPTWYPVVAMTAGIVATSWIGTATVDSWGVLGIAAANAAGITLTALILLYGMGSHSVPIRTWQVLAGMSRPLRAAVVACGLGGFGAALVDSPALGLTAGGTAVALVFLLLAGMPGGQGLTPALRTVTRRLPHARFR